jgi:hypothetical protein
MTCGLQCIEALQASMGLEIYTRVPQHQAPLPFCASPTPTRAPELYAHAAAVSRQGGEEGSGTGLQWGGFSASAAGVTITMQPGEGGKEAALASGSRATGRTRVTGTSRVGVQTGMKTGMQTGVQTGRRPTLGELQRARDMFQHSDSKRPRPS